MDWRQAVEAEPAGILVGDRDGRLTYLNPAAARALGADPAEALTGRLVSDLLGYFPAAAAAPRILPSGESVW